MENMVDGFKLMGIGMGMVFLFLALMVWVINATAKLLAPYAHLLAEPVAARSGSGEVRSGRAASDNDLLSAVVAAVHRHRSRR
ncbi:MAG: OadG family protein [Victivallales bacterium]|nr:OadG family protein [Victivallales bacterium]